MPPPPPSLTDELVEEILLRLPPDSPASLFRAGLVCKRWCHLVTDPAFRRRFIDFHGRAPPMLGFMIYSREARANRFVPTSASRALQPHGNICGLKAFDSRHGRVLLRNTGSEYPGSIRIVVWNPTTGEQLKLPEPPRCNPFGFGDPYQWTAAVLCAAAAADVAGACDHLDYCNREAFIVVLVGTTTYRIILVRIYNSEAGAWSEPTLASLSGDDSIDSSVRSTLVGKTLYFVLRGRGSGMSDYKFGDNRRTRYRYNCQNILEYNLGTRRISVVQLPRACNSMFREPFEQIELTTTEDGRLGFVRVEHYSTLCLWSREVEEPAGWALRKTIELAHLLPSDGHRLPWEWVYWRYLVGSVEGVGTIFLRFKDDELLTVDLRSRRVTKVYTHQVACLTTVIPYTKFCTPCTKSIQP